MEQIPEKRIKTDIDDEVSEFYKAQGGSYPGEELNNFACQDGDGVMNVDSF